MREWKSLLEILIEAIDWGRRRRRRPTASHFPQPRPPSSTSATHQPTTTTKKQLSLDDYGTFRVVNFIRSEVAAGRDPKPALAEAAAAGEKKEGKAAAAPWDDDAFLVPVNPEDPLLFYEYEDEEGNEAAAAEQTRESADPSIASSSLRAENEALRSALAALAAASLPPEAAAALPAAIVEALRGVGWGGGDGGDGEEEKPRGGSGGALLLKKGASSSSAKGNGTATPPSSSSQRKEQEVDDAYFDSYGGLGIHREMLSDEARTGAYRQALEENPSLIEDATVLDVGAGTGVLSLFAARAGAAAVVAVEASERVAALARQNAVANGFGTFVSSGNDDSTATTVTVVNARLEDIERLPGIGGSEGKEGGGGEESDEDRDRVDVLVSEWMGYALFFECMLDSVILARDRFLKKRGGAILPDRVRESFLFFLSSFFDFFSTFFVFRKSHSCFFSFPLLFPPQTTNQPGNRLHRGGLPSGQRPPLLGRRPRPRPRGVRERGEEAPRQARRRRVCRARPPRDDRSQGSRARPADLPRRGRGVLDGVRAPSAGTGEEGRGRKRREEEFVARRDRALV